MQKLAKSLDSANDFNKNNSVGLLLNKNEKEKKNVYLFLFTKRSVTVSFFIIVFFHG